MTNAGAVDQELDGTPSAAGGEILRRTLGAVGVNADGRADRGSLPRAVNGIEARATREAVTAAVSTAPEALVMAMTQNVEFCIFAN